MREEEDKFSLALITSSTLDFDRVPPMFGGGKNHKKYIYVFWTDLTKNWNALNKAPKEDIFFISQCQLLPRTKNCNRVF